MPVSSEKMQAEIFGVLRKRDKPASAYDILNALRPTKPKIAPTTVYRALSALVDRGCVHRLESLNAYMVCRCDAHGEAPILSICRDCGSVAETVSTEILSKLSGIARKSGIVPSRHVIEVHGVCVSCDGSEGGL